MKTGSQSATMKRQNTPPLLNYVCFPDNEERVTLASGKEVIEQPHAFVDLSKMRANTFQLQGFRQDALEGLTSESEGVLMTRQPKLYPSQMQSIILAKGSKVKVCMSFPEIQYEFLHDIFDISKVISSDKLIGPARVTSGSILDI